jgi:predicted TIM-barrel fold metal-dependent hydrolase
MELKDVQAIDGSVLYHYLNGELTKDQYNFHEPRAMTKTTFAAFAKKKGFPPGEEWRAIASFCKNSVEEVLVEMDEAGIQYAFVLLGKAWSQHDHTLWYGYNPQIVIDMVNRGKGKLIGAASYNPFRIKESLDEIDMLVKQHGFKYVWFHPISFGMRPDDRRCYPLYAKCLDLGIPVGMQTGHSAEALTSEPGHPMAADNVAIEFPDLTIILTHTGWPWIDEWCSMIWRHVNVYGMVNAYMPSGLKPATVEFMDSPRGRDKVLWGSHFYGMTRWKKEFLALSISDETRRKVLRDNPLKVFKLPG